MEKNIMLSRDGKEEGEIINLQAYPCQMMGCTGMRISVRWPVGKRTFPCSKGCTQVNAHTWQID